MSMLAVSLSTMKSTMDSKTEENYLSQPPTKSMVHGRPLPRFNFNLRGSAYRSDTVTPLGPNKTLIEFKGYGLLSDTPEERQTRINHHNSIWDTFGRNLHEDLIGVAGQGVTMREGTEDRYVLHGRHENSTIHDEVGMRHYYSEWGKYVDIDPYMLDKVA